MVVLYALGISDLYISLVFKDPHLLAKIIDNPSNTRDIWANSPHVENMPLYSQ